MHGKWLLAIKLGLLEIEFVVTGGTVFSVSHASEETPQINLEM